MSEEVLNKEVQNVEAEKIDKVKTSLNKLNNKKSKFIFCIPESLNPSASVYEIYFHATIVKKMGYNVILMVEKPEYEIPKWIEKDLTDFKHIPMSDPKISVGPEDIMIIPEVYSNIMEQTKNLPCLRVGLLQSVDYMLNSLIPGTDWSSFGIKDIITTSETLKRFVNNFYGEGKFKIKTYSVGIPDYFKRTDMPQKPIISIIGRNPNDIAKIIKLFFTKFPQYGWVTFDAMLTRSKPPQTMRRKDFADRLRENFAAVWIDKISSFGTFPLECMKSGTIPICLKPDIIPEYIIETDEDGKSKISNGAGIWTDNFYDIPLLIGEVLIKFLDDNIASELYNDMEKIASKYTQKNSEEKLGVIYQEFINDRIKLFNSALQEKKKPKEDGKEK